MKYLDRKSLEAVLRTSVFSLLFVAASLLGARPAQATTITIGETTILPTTDGGNANLLIAQAATLSTTASIQSLSFYVGAAAGNLRLGIYDSTGPGGGPGAKKAETNSFAPVVGWNTANVISQVSLPAGNYWIAYLASSNSLQFKVTSGGTTTSRVSSFTFGVMPTTFSTSPSTCGCHWSFYATLASGTITDTTPPSTTTGLTATVISSSQINLSWTASTDNVGVTGYKIFRNGAQINTSATNSYSDTGLTPSTTYTYSVSAFDAAGNNSPMSATVSPTTQSLPFAFTVANGGNKSVGRGSSVTNSITATLSSGTPSTVSFSAAGLPSGVTASFNPTSCAPTCTTTLTLTAGTSAALRASTITVTASGGGVSVITLPVFP